MTREERLWSVTREEALQALGTDAVSGLPAGELQRRLKQAGPNKLTEPVKTTFWGTFWDEVREPMILLLIVVGIIYSIWGKLGDVITIFSVIVLLVLSEVFTEYRAHSAISALRKLTPNTAKVIRGGAHMQVPAEEIVPGDIVPLEAGDRVPADGRVIESFGLQVDESPLTGESAPVSKMDKVLSRRRAPYRPRQHGPCRDHRDGGYRQGCRYCHRHEYRDRQDSRNRAGSKATADPFAKGNARIFGPSGLGCGWLQRGHSGGKHPAGHSHQSPAV